MRLDLGSPVRCADGHYGELGDVVLEPATKRVTHLVVVPHDRPIDARLVPIALLRAEEPGPDVHLSGTVEDVERLDALRESAYLRFGEEPEPGAEWDMGIERTDALPFVTPAYDISGMTPVDPDPHVMVSYDRVPKGEVELRRKSTVASSDGHLVGHVDALIVDDQGGQLTHVVLEHGHLWGKREVSIPIADVAGVRSDEIVLGLTKDEVGALEQVRAHRRHD